MTDTQTPPDPATFDVHPLYHLIDLAQAVSDREEDVQAAAKRVRERAESVERDLDRGGSLNRLGELQGTGPALDAAVAALEQAAAAFRTGRIYLAAVVDQARLITDPEVKFAGAVISMVEWLDRVVAASPRAKKIWESHS